MNEISEKSQDVFRSYFHGNDIVIVAPLNWGLGHASRCIPVIHWLIQHCAQVIIASDGESLELLKKEFPQLTFESCPGYNIRYKYENILVNMLMALPTMIRAVNRENTELLYHSSDQHSSSQQTNSISWFCPPPMVYQKI